MTYEIKQLVDHVWVLPAGLEPFYLTASQRQKIFLKYVTIFKPAKAGIQSLN